MQPILVDGGQLVLQGTIEILNDIGIALHVDATESPGFR
jgi:hypothetical protein